MHGRGACVHFTLQSAHGFAIECRCAFSPLPRQIRPGGRLTARLGRCCCSDDELNQTAHSNIVWSNGALDPWSGQGVYPPGGGPQAGKPMVQNISADGSQIALVLDLGAHHLDLMFSDPRNPPCFAEARKVEEKMIRQWCQEAYDAL